MIEDLGFKIEVDYQTAAEKVPQLRSQSLEPLKVQQSVRLAIRAPCGLTGRLFEQPSYSM
jgi:hypothetical protein